MKEQHKNIKFKNQQNSKAQFDLVKLEELIHRTDLDHSIDLHHKVEFYVLLFIESGHGSHNIDFIDYPCSKGTILTIRKDQINKFYKSGSLQGSLLIFTDDFLVSYLEDAQVQKTMLLFNELIGVPKLQLYDFDFKDILQRVQRINYEYFDLNDKHSLGIIRSELHILITQLFRIKSVTEQINFEKKYLKEFIEFQNLVEVSVSKVNKVQEYAQMLNISSKTLNTVTKTIIHKSAKEFIDEIRTKQIKRLLINTKLSIKEIAYESGFEETTNFFKYFKRQTGTTPEQFRLPN